MQLIDQLLKKLPKNTHTENIIFGWISKNSLHMQCPSLLLLYATRSALSVGRFPHHDRCRSLMLPWSSISTANTAHTSCSQPHAGRLGSSIKTLQKEKQPLDLISATFIFIFFCLKLKQKGRRTPWPPAGVLCGSAEARQHAQLQRLHAAQRLGTCCWTGRSPPPRGWQELILSFIH